MALLGFVCRMDFGSGAWCLGLELLTMFASTLARCEAAGAFRVASTRISMGFQAMGPRFLRRSEEALFPGSSHPDGAGLTLSGWRLWLLSNAGPEFGFGGTVHGRRVGRVKGHSRLLARPQR